MDQNKYWQTFGELNNPEAFEKSTKDEFKELLPLEDVAGILEGKTARRDFLKYLGFSTAAAALAASCEMPVRKSIPYLNKRDDIMPGVANYYASTYVNDGDVVPVVVKQREGRPIKIEGNTLSPITKGGTSAQVQASVLDLYDVSRLRYPMANGKEATFEAIDKLVGEAMAGAAGKPVVLLTSSIGSPTTSLIIKDFLAKYPGSRHIQYDAVSYSGMIMANQASYGKRAIPSYRLDKAKIIVSLGADFLGTWLSPVVFNRQYAENRRINMDKPQMSKHFQFEGHMSLTGANADERYMHKPSETGAVAVALLAALTGGSGSVKDARLAEGIKKAATELAANKGAALVVSGSNDVNVQTVVNAINNAIGANGATIDWSSTVNYRQGVDSDIVGLTEDLNAGKIGALIVYGANPVYNFYAGDRFAEGVKKCPVTISYSEKLDETAELCKFVIPSSHWLESWGDAEGQTGYVSLIQPVIHPLFKTRQFQTSLLKLAEVTVPAPAARPAGAGPVLAAGDQNNADYENYFRTYWVTKLGGVEKYYQALQDGIINAAGATTTTTSDSTKSAATTLFTAPAVAVPFTGNVADATGKLSSVKGGDIELVLYQKVGIGTGNQASNPWLQELPDPITKATWDNYALMSPALAKTLLGIDMTKENKNARRETDAYEVNREKPVVTIKANGKTITLPVLILPGIHPNVIALAVGYGRESADKNKSKEYIGVAAIGSGKNVFPLATFNGTTVDYMAVASVEKAPGTYMIAQNQIHNITEGRPVIRETTLAKFIEDPKDLGREEDEELANYGDNYVKDATLYPTFDKPGIKWGMSIDLNTCTGCSACVVACHAENNVPVVGKVEVARFHEMHWLRIDRYFTGDVENPDVVFQPMLCQHCDNAPCENVCPVAATNHSSEGLNQMAYNRCIGTRYCANNCPYKVRRFNWADYTGADSFPDNQKEVLSETTMMMNDDLVRMVLNPDVTVRSHGVMEKCSFCVQRLQEGKLNAKKANRPLQDQEVRTACAQACPTNAIEFGNINDKESRIYKIRNEEQKERKFYVLEQLHVLSNVNYLAKVRNTDRVVGSHAEGAEHQGGVSEKEHRKEPA